ncbi:MAG: AAA family ATPase, partial [Planctomycetota bacterium]|nr:AAA family ATPase [Planctomycetota bacterium]
MYTTYWKLNVRPFDSSFDRRFYYPSEAHQATLLKLRYAIENRRGAALLAGASGLGKTLLVHALHEDLPEEYGPLVHVRFAQMAPTELLSFLADGLTGETSGEAAVNHSVQRIEQALAKNVESHRHAVVVIDEAQLLRDTGGLETVRLLLNFEAAWTLLLVAQPAILPALERMPELEERLSVKCLLRRFTLEETVSYIHHRMLAASTIDTPAIFEPTSLETIHRLTDGIPRRIHRLCDLCLLIGDAEDLPQITPTHVAAVAEELATTVG